MLLAENTPSARPLPHDKGGGTSLPKLPMSSRERLLACSREVTVPASRPLFEQGSLHTCTYFVQEGLVRTYYTAATGREITLAYWSEGDLVGGPNFFGGGYHIWSGVAVRDTRAYAVDDGDMKRLSVEDPAILFWVAETMAFKLRWLSILFQLHGTQSIRHRLAKLLVMLSEIYGVPDGDGGVLIKHKITQGDLATLVGASRQWTNKTLNELIRADLLEITNFHIRILDIKSLSSMNGQEAVLFD